MDRQLPTSTPSDDSLPPAHVQPIRVDESSGRTVVQLLGEIDFSAVLRITARLDTLTERPAADVVIDLRLVDFLDCSGLGLLCRARRRTEEQGGRLALTGTPPSIRKLLRMVGLHRVFVFADALDEPREGQPHRTPGTTPSCG